MDQKEIPAFLGFLDLLNLQEIYMLEVMLLDLQIYQDSTKMKGNLLSNRHIKYIHIVHLAFLYRLWIEYFLSLIHISEPTRPY